jgi:serine/threonine protein phosphatase 1
MNQKTIVIGDIHGALLALKDLLNQINLSANDTLIFLGDYVDGWSDSFYTIEFLIQLKKTNRCVFLRGNHDDLFLQYLKTNTYNEEWLKHGGQSTIEAYQNKSKEQIEKHIDFLENLKDYHLDDHNRLFVHAGFTNIKGVDYEYFNKMFYWDRSLWELAVALDKNLTPEDIYYPERLKIYKEIYIGHTPTTRLNAFKPLQFANVINVDTGAAFKGPLSAVEINMKKLWQSKPAFEWYPNENGRN